MALSGAALHRRGAPPVACTPLGQVGRTVIRPSPRGEGQAWNAACTALTSDPPGDGAGLCAQARAHMLERGCSGLPGVQGFGPHSVGTWGTEGPRAAVVGETLGKAPDQLGLGAWAVRPPPGPRGGASGHGCPRRRAHGPVGGPGRPLVPITVRCGAEDRLPACVL